MTTRITAHIHVDPSQLKHAYERDEEGDHARIVLGRMNAYLHFRDTGAVDGLIAELVALRNEMDPYFPAAGCAEMDDGYICNGHDGRAHHLAYGPEGEVCHRWPVAVPAAAELETAGSAA